MKLYTCSTPPDPRECSLVGLDELLRTGVCWAGLRILGELERQSGTFHNRLSRLKKVSSFSSIIAWMEAGTIVFNPGFMACTASGGTNVRAPFRTRAVLSPLHVVGELRKNPSPTRSWFHVRVPTSRQAAPYLSSPSSLSFLLNKEDNGSFRRSILSFIRLLIAPYPIVKEQCYK